jgi:hypothetical protein
VDAIDVLRVKDRHGNTPVHVRDSLHTGDCFLLDLSVPLRIPGEDISFIGIQERAFPRRRLSESGHIPGDAIKRA